MATIYTIGFSGKNIDVLRKVLNAVGVRKLIDIRRWPVSKYAPWADGKNLAVAFGDMYVHMPELTPESAMLADYKAGNTDWNSAIVQLNELFTRRVIQNLFTTDSLHKICLLCTEKTATQCHRRIVAEYLAAHFPDVTIVHL